MIARIGRWLLYGAAFVVVFLIGLRLTFPMQLVARALEAQAEKALDFEYDVTIDRARFSGIVGVKLLDVSVVKRPTAEGEVNLPIRFKSVRGSVGLLSLLGETPNVKLHIRIGDDGEIRVAYGSGEETPTSVRAEFFTVQLADITPLQQKLGMPLVGAMSGTVMLNYEEGWRMAGGDIDIGIENVQLGPGIIRHDALHQIGGELPQVLTDFGVVRLRGPINGSNIVVEEFAVSGQDIRMNADGEIQLRSPFATSRVDMGLDFQFDGAFLERAGLGGVLGLPEVQRLQVGDGYAVTLAGPLTRPSMVPGARRR